jgi:hypothetical protein
MTAAAFRRAFPHSSIIAYPKTKLKPNRPAANPLRFQFGIENARGF